MRKYSFPVEIHTHTEHSDGSFTPEGLVEAAKAFGYRGIILTDHNSSSGYRDLVRKKRLEGEEFIVLKGMEWTTYFGHMLVHEADYDVDWRNATPETIDAYMKEVKKAHGLIGIAHPFDMGSPICTGCHWEFKVKDYHLVDYIEIWNSNDPHTKPESQAAYEFWLQKLNEGYKISASTGRDWHGPDEEDVIMGVTYVEIDENRLTKENFKNALAKGQFYITLGPEVIFNLVNENNYYFTGDEISKEALKNGKAQFTLTPTTLKKLQHFLFQNVQIKLWNNEKLIYSSKHLSILSDSQEYHVSLPDCLEEGYVRFEVVQQLEADQEIKLVIGNPIYIR